MYLKRN